MYCYYVKIEIAIYSKLLNKLGFGIGYFLPTKPESYSEILIKQIKINKSNAIVLQDLWNIVQFLIILSAIMTHILNLLDQQLVTVDGFH